MDALRKSFIFCLALAPLLFSGCKRPQEPLQNFVAIRTVSFDPKRLQEYDGQAEIFMQIETLPNHNVISRSRTLTLPINKRTTFVHDRVPFWSAPYIEHEKAVLTSGQSGIALSLKAQTDYCRGFWNEDMTAVAFDFHILPFSKPLLFKITDKPGATRSLKDATGAEFILSLQREIIGGSGLDLPRERSFPALIEAWWLNEKMTYDEYAFYYLTTERIFEAVFGSEADTIVLKNDEKTLKKIKAKIEASVIEQLKVRDREAYASAILRDPESADYSKAELFYKWAVTDSDFNLAKNLATEKVTALAQKYAQKLAASSYGAKIVAYLGSSAEKHKLRAVENENLAIEYLRSIKGDILEP